MSNIYKKTEFKLIANLVTFYLSTAIQQKNAAYKNYRNNSANNEFISLQCLRKEVRDEVDFLHLDNRESFL